jgi:hypothetical protein
MTFILIIGTGAYPTNLQNVRDEGERQREGERESEEKEEEKGEESKLTGKELMETFWLPHDLKL